MVRRDRIEAEVADELHFHLEREVEANLSRGMSAVEARRAAIRDLGGLAQTHEAVRDVRTAWFDATGHLLQDLRYAIRVWAKRPGFTAIAIVVLGFGIASTTRVFSLVNAVLLHSLPFAQVDRLVLLWQQDLSSGRDRITLSPAEYVGLLDSIAIVRVDRRRSRRQPDHGHR
ncbi:MAG TPA: permease prefix domain 1-containing protein [Vicinamibacterales bacterium]|nr:permease prefix domain 1-containing protein [Vicinamibacterales bacterium]